MLLWSAPATTGTIEVRGKPVALHSTDAAIANGLALIPADRRGAGALLVMSVQENIVAANLRRVSGGGVVTVRAGAHAPRRNSVRELDIKVASLTQRMATLSGGNQQKVILARGLFTERTRADPARAARAASTWAPRPKSTPFCASWPKQGVAILIVSSELPELIGQCDRILVLHGGRLTGEFDRRRGRRRADSGLRHGPGRAI